MTPWYSGLSLLLVDDDERLTTRLASSFEVRNLRVRIANSLDEALNTQGPGPMRDRLSLTCS